MKYTYVISVQTANGKVDTYKLEKEIQASDISIALDYIKTILTSDNLDVEFKAELSIPELSTLDSIVQNHDGATLVEPDKIEITNVLKNEGIADANGKRARLVGMCKDTVPAGTIKNFDYKMEQIQFQGEDKNSIFNGVEYYAKNADNFDELDFQIVDKDGFGVLVGWYDQLTFNAMGNLYVVEEFGSKVFVMPDNPIDIILYKSNIVPGLYIRAKYKSHGSEDVKFSMNLFRHLVEE